MLKSFDPEKEQVLSRGMDDITRQINCPETWQQVFQRIGLKGTIRIDLAYAAEDDEPTIMGAVKFPGKQYILKFAPRKNGP